MKLYLFYHRNSKLTPEPTNTQLPKKKVAIELKTTSLRHVRTNPPNEPQGQCTHTNQAHTPTNPGLSTVRTTSASTQKAGECSTTASVTPEEFHRNSDISSAIPIPRSKITILQLAISKCGLVVRGEKGSNPSNSSELGLDCMLTEL
jgi:hypothetical protein